MLQASVSIKGDLLKEIELAKEVIKDDIVDNFEVATRNAIQRSPVWSGAYVKSFSVKVNGSGPTRSRTANRDMRVDEATAKTEALNQVMSDLVAADGLRLEDLKSITLLNRAPHANLVEGGTPTQPAGGIFAMFRDEIRTIRNVSVRRGRRS